MATPLGNPRRTPICGADKAAQERLLDYRNQQESTGVFWKPVFNILEGHGMQVWVVYAQHLKKVPGRKTDVTDAQWIAQLLQCGLLRPSFVPERGQRDLTRQRMRLVQQRTTIANRAGPWGAGDVVALVTQRPTARQLVS